MNIIVLENEPSSRRGGQELSLLEVCRGLSQRGHTITLLYLKAGDLLDQYREFCTNILKVDDYDYDRRKLKALLKFFADIWKIPVGQNTVIYSNRYHDVSFGYLLALLKRSSFVCHLRLPPPEGLGTQHIRGIKGAKKFITTSKKTKLDWIQSGFLNEGKIEVVHNTINSQKFLPSRNFYQTRQKRNIPANTKVISYVGRLDREKGLETLIKAFALLQKNSPNSRLLIAGKTLSTEEAYQKTLKQLCADLGVEKDVDFLGHVSDTVSLYQTSDVTVLPSLWSEPFGRVILESMACGTPVVASRVGGIPEVLTGEFQRGLFEPGNEQDLLAKLTGILNWREMTPLLGKRCREYVLDKFRSERMVDSIEKVLLKAVISPSTGNSAKRILWPIPSSQKAEDAPQPSSWL